ncbi:protochlorophyllide-dependent translocon component 52, chloroplastic-like [Tripterygium wilfordii]|uniref:protochlorophyllide-dependent translocon component 52, chloroplastic-like n=1 Tax=Tripterygium wilfordii TaxID=458696 RepID=UPI0018F82D92|nr:protochlorophyllide-dependent translocon component 52, chloroplastic-like [Tripterygium wilfordii]
MEALRASLFNCLHMSTKSTTLHKNHFPKSMFLNLQSTDPLPNSSYPTFHNKVSKFKAFTSTVSTDPKVETGTEGEKFDWFSQWYPVMPVCDLDKRVPHAKTVMGLDVVVWWDRHESAWKVFDDSCPHRLAPLSEGRIDQWGRLQCVYHGWCFSGSGDCKFIPQAPPDGPPVHTFKKACVAVYPSTVQNEILWFWPNSDPQYNDIISKKKPPYIAELDDPSYTKLMMNREFPFGYEILVENLADPAHLPYAHYGLVPNPYANNRDKADREGGIPIEFSIQKSDIEGFNAARVNGATKFIAPCVYYSEASLRQDHANMQGNKWKVSANVAPRRVLLVLFCVPFSPGKSRLIFSFPRNFGVWIDWIVPRWMNHINHNLILDSDLYFLHVEELKLMDVGPRNWQKACFMPTKSDAQVVAFRKWLKKFSDGQINWGDKYPKTLPPSPPKEQLMDRYWSHVVNCSSCSRAYKGLNALEVVLQLVSIVSLGIVAATKHGVLSATARTALVSMAVLCFAASKWLSNFIYKNFHFHDYNHALR